MYSVEIQYGKAKNACYETDKFNEAINSGKEDIFWNDHFSCREVLIGNLAEIFIHLKDRPGFTILVTINGWDIDSEHVKYIFNSMFYFWKIENNQLIFKNHLPSIYQLSLALLLLDDHYEVLNKSRREIARAIINSDSDRWEDIEDSKVLTAFFLFLNSSYENAREFTLHQYYAFNSGPAENMETRIYREWHRLEEFYFYLKEDIDKNLRDYSFLKRLLSIVNLEDAEHRAQYYPFE